jgi:DNA-binding protein H-NS
MSTIESLMAKISVLQKKASALKDVQKKRAIAEIRKQIELYDLQPAELFSNTQPVIGKAVVSEPASTIRKTRKTGKKSLPPKYQDPATGKTWNGHGKPPSWLAGVSDRTAFLIGPQAEVASDVASDVVKPARRGRGKAKSSASKKPNAAKATETAKAATKQKSAISKKYPVKRKTTARKNSKKQSSTVSATNSNPDDLPTI